MTDQDHHDGPFDLDDPLTMMGIAMVGMTLQDMAEKEEQEEQERSTYRAPAPPPSASGSTKDVPTGTWLIIAIVAAVAIMLLCGFLASTSGL